MYVSYSKNKYFKYMFAKTTHVDFAQRVVATLVASALVLGSFGSYARIAQAVNLVDVSNTLSTSNPGVTSAHFFQFTIPAGESIAIGEDITISFPTGPDEFSGVVANMDLADITATINGASVTEAGYAEGTVGNTQYFTFNSSNVAGAAGQVVTVAIPDGVITNPTATTSHEIVITVDGGRLVGKTRIAIVDTILVTAYVDTTFDFVIEGLATSTVGNPIAVGSASTTGSSTPTTLNFGKLTADKPEALAQRLRVTTNAREGFVVTVESDGNFQSANGAIIDNFVDGLDQDTTGQQWVDPSEDISDDTTWGHWGLTTSDGDLNSLGGYYTEEFGVSDSYIAASTTPRVIFHHDGPSDGETQDKGQATVLYRVQITPLQEAATDYNTTLTYIATPTF
jgi:hypothetical protein